MDKSVKKKSVTLISIDQQDQEMARLIMAPKQKFRVDIIMQSPTSWPCTRRPPVAPRTAAPRRGRPSRSCRGSPPRPRRRRCRPPRGRSRRRPRPSARWWPRRCGTAGGSAERSRRRKSWGK